MWQSLKHCAKQWLDGRFSKIYGPELENNLWRIRGEEDRVDRYLQRSRYGSGYKKQKVKMFRTG